MARKRKLDPNHPCPHCGSIWVIKYGKSRGKQTYKCRRCHYRFTPDAKRHLYPERVKQEAIKLYLEGMSMSAISRSLGVKLGTVYSWIKRRGKKRA